MQAPPPESIWYLPHHPVTNPNKPGKVRRVANAASKFRDESLNSNLLTGPDLLNNLVGVLLRFREHPVAVLSDIEGMFMQIAVRQEDQSALRFLWMIDNSIRQFQFTRLIFGATCSPFCAIYVLNKCAEDNKSEFPAALNAIKHHFYMDDYIQSLPTISEAKEVISQTTRCLKNGGFRLTKFVSNQPDVLAEISSDDKDETKEITRVLGQKWNITTDDFVMFPLQQFPKDATVSTQRKIFSLVSSIFDPFGLLSPLTIRIKMVLQQIWKLGRKWDYLIPHELHHNLQKVLNSYFAMPEIRILKTVHNFSKITSSQLHIFVDASMAAMAAVAYLRTTNSQTAPPQACFLMGKCKVAPIKQISVPKMVLEAAVIGVRLLQLIQREMTLTFGQVFLWSDSQVVLDRIASNKKQNVFVSNRLREIHKSSSPQQWHHISTYLNPADHGTRGLETKEIQQKWLDPPQFLCQSELTWNEINKSRATGAAVTRSPKTIKPIVGPSKFSTWNKLLLTVATVFNLINRAKKMRTNNHQYTTEDIQLSRNYLLKLSQDSFFHSTVNYLQRGIKLDSKCKIRCLNPLLDEDGLLRSCGRLQYAPTQLDLEKRPIILHAKDKIVRLYLEHAHQICIHWSTEPTKAFIQQRYHVIGLRKALASVRFHCFLCRRFDTKNIQLIIAPLPSFRFPTTKTQFPFANSGIDFFGPFYIEDSKGILEKHYGLIFTCLVTRAVHLETCPDLNTDTFLNAFRRFAVVDASPNFSTATTGKLSLALLKN